MAAMQEPRPAGPLYISSAVFAQRDGAILLLKRAMGEATGGWYLPGGALDQGETIEQCARRELREECGLSVSGALAVVATAHMHVYGHDSLQVLFAGGCPDGEPALSHEHSGFRWMDPVIYRDRYFADAILEQVTARDARYGAMLTNIRAAIDAYLAWRARGRAAAR